VKGILDFPLTTQRKSWTCGPAVVSSVAKFFKYRLSEENAATLMLTTKRHGTKPNNLLWCLYVCKVCRPTARYMTPLREVKLAVDKGYPVIVLWDDWRGHWATVIGYDKHFILLADPANPKTGMRVHRISNFRKHWHAKVAGRRYRQLAIICKPL
jgi:ABC-type bacteriocin/lantibiotic exporter with double-glycine peptidase domain